MQTGLAAEMAPPFKVVSKYFITAICFFLTLTFLMAFNYESLTGFHFQPKILSIVHLTVLGWITMVIFGALYQLIPVVLEVEIYSKTLAEIQFWFFTVGTIGLSLSFWYFRTGAELIISALVVTFSIFIFVLNVFFTLRKVIKWNITGYYLSASIFYLLMTALLGFFLSFNLSTGIFTFDHLSLLRVHAHIGFTGWFLMVIIGVALKLIPMFALSHDYSMLPAKIIFPLVNAGLILLIFNFPSPEATILTYTAILLIISGLLLFLFQLIIILKHRLRKVYDTGLRFSLISFSFLLLIIGTIFFILFRSNVQSTGIISTYGILILFGFISLLVKAQMYKIVPFLVWYKKYSSKAGIEKVPMLKDMFNDTLAYSELVIYLFGVAGILVGFLAGSKAALQGSFLMISISTILFGYNIFSIYKK